MGYPTPKYFFQFEPEVSEISAFNLPNRQTNSSALYYWLYIELLVNTRNQLLKKCVVEAKLSLLKKQFFVNCRCGIKLFR